MSDIFFINANAEQQQAVTSLIATLEAGHIRTIAGSLLFDTLDGKGAELVIDGATSGREGALDATIWTDDDDFDQVEVAKVRITVEVLS